MQDHPIAGIFPLLPEKELAELAADIKANGLKQPIWTYEGKILDGRNRFRACKSAGVDPSFEVYRGESPAGFVVSLNLKRRHLTPSQAAAIAVESLPWFEKEAKKRQGTRNDKRDIPQKIAGSEAREQAASLLNTNRQYVSDAKVIKEKAPETFEAVKRGEKTIADAKREIKKAEHSAKIEAAAKNPPAKPQGPFDLGMPRGLPPRGLPRGLPCGMPKPTGRRINFAS